jgi:hypothetical protein
MPDDAIDFGPGRIAFDVNSMALSLRIEAGLLSISI